jgi:hypothetical protein
MQAVPYLVAEFFNGEKQSLIPLFQRPYVWERDRWSTLWDDLIEKYEDTAGTSRHFMGAVVSLPATTVPVGVTKHLIIDGQQRLTTLAVLLRAIQHALDGSPEGGRVADLLVNRHRSGVERYKVLPTQPDRPAFIAVMDNPGDAPTDHRITQCFRFFVDRLSERDDAGAPIDARRALGVIERHLQVVSIGLDGADNPYEIFESLNFKGQPLTQADLVRNDVLMRFSHDVSDGGAQECVYRDHWQPMEQQLGESLTEFFRHYLMRAGEEVREADVYVTTKRRFDAASDPDAVLEQLKSMRSYADHYAVLLQPGRAAAAEITKALSTLRRVEVTTTFPFLLNVLAAWHAKQISTTEVVDVITNIESFIVRRMLCAVPSNSVGRIFLQLARDCPVSGIATWLAGELLKQTGNRRWPTDEEVLAACLTQNQYNRKSTPAVLTKLEEQYEHKEPVDLSGATVEHILPQTLNESWREMLGAHADEHHARWVHMLGNFTLTGYNSELSNLPFVSKAKRYAESHIELSRELASLDRWDAAAIEARGKRLGGLLVMLYSRPTPVRAAAA